MAVELLGFIYFIFHRLWDLSETGELATRDDP